MEEKDVDRLAKLYGKPLLIKPHHSYDDWYFHGPNWPNYDNTDYISPPTCLCSEIKLPAQYYGHAVLKTYPCLPELRIVNNIKWVVSFASSHIDYFRAQAYPVGSVYYPAYCYAFRFANSQVTLMYIEGGSPSIIKHYVFSPYLSLATWYKYRFSLWDLPNHAAPTMIAYRFELWENEAWKSYLEGTSSPSRWYNSSVNYYGTYLHHSGAYNQKGFKIDDTEIWIPAT